MHRIHILCDLMVRPAGRTNEKTAPALQSGRFFMLVYSFDLELDTFKVSSVTAE